MIPTTQCHREIPTSGAVHIAKSDMECSIVLGKVSRFAPSRQIGSCQKYTIMILLSLVTALFSFNVEADSKSTWSFGITQEKKDIYDPNAYHSFDSSVVYTKQLEVLESILQRNDIQILVLKNQNRFLMLMIGLLVVLAVIFLVVGNRRRKQLQCCTPSPHNGQSAQKSSRLVYDAASHSYVRK